MRGKGIIAGVTKQNGTTTIPGGLYVVQTGDKLVLVIERRYAQTIQELLDMSDDKSGNMSDDKTTNSKGVN